MAALLAHKMMEAGQLLTREMWANLDDWWIVNVICRPDFHRGNAERGYWPVGRVTKENRTVGGPMGPRELFMTTTGKHMRTMGFSEEEVETRYKEWAKPLAHG